MQLDLSIVIVNWNTRDITRDCLRSVYDNTRGIAFELIVVDNASSDGSVEMIQKQFPQAILIKNTDNRGFAAANNQGIAISKGRYVLLLNSDTVVLGDALEKTVHFADANPHAGVVSCQVLNPDRSIQQTCFMFPSFINMLLSSLYLYKLFPESTLFGREKMTWWARDDMRPVDVVTGCFMLVRSTAIEQVGVMDEQFFMYGEETDWCWRFKQAGWAVIFAPVGQIIHLGGQSAKKSLGPMLLQLKGSILLFIKKHKSSVEYALCCLLTALFFAFRLPVWAAIAVSRRPRDNTAMRCWFYAKGALYSLLGASALCVKR